MDECSVELGAGSTQPGRLGVGLLWTQLLSDCAKEVEIPRTGNWHVALADWLHQVSRSRGQAGESYALDVGAACDAFFDDVGDPRVELVEQGLEVRAVLGG